MNIIISGFGKIGSLLFDKLKGHRLFIVDERLDYRFEDIKEEIDLVIDFSSSSHINVIYQFLKNNPKTDLIIGTTGYSQEQLKLINDLSKSRVVVISSNYSKGMNILFALIESLKTFDLRDENITLIETHHQNKIDSPSGTSKTIISKFNRKIKVISKRKNDVVGVHQLEINLKDEKIILKHQALSRNAFIVGVEEIVPIIKTLNQGLYTLEDLSLWKEKK